MLEKNIVVGPFQCNCRLLVCEKTGDALLIDPGDESSKILSAIQKTEQELGKTINLMALLHTHAHLDHIGATRGVKEAKSSSSIYLHKLDLEIYEHLQDQGRMFGLDYETPLPVDKFVEDEEEISIGTLKLKVIHTPGHSPGSVCFHLREDSDAKTKETVFSGDTLFLESVGRTDLWGASSEQLVKSIKTRLFTLDGDTRVAAGHGSDSTIAHEKRENPFLT